MSESLPPDAGAEERTVLPALRPDPRHWRTQDTPQAQAQLLFPQIPIFKGMEPHHLRQLARIAGSRGFAAGETIIRMGEPGAEMYVIRSGRVKVVLERPTESVVLAVLGPGDFFGELSIFDGEARSATVTAIEDTETLTLWRFDVMQMVSRSPELAWSLLKSLSARLRAANARLNAEQPGVLL